RLNPPDADGNYLVDHAAFIYLMDPQGRYVRHFSHNTPPETMAKELRRIALPGAEPA
ncbi:MAG TPA: SCO family protein, partial [Thermopetrobacter sp.]|nr:SCO family protein [Thermopetrobacter sp.]